jgi:hypothetical protein
MDPLFLVTVLNCQQVGVIINRLQKIAFLTEQQKIEIVTELRKSVTSCPVIIKLNESKKKSSN